VNADSFITYRVWGLGFMVHGFRVYYVLLLLCIYYVLLCIIDIMYLLCIIRVLGMITIMGLWFRVLECIIYYYYYVFIIYYSVESER